MISGPAVLLGGTHWCLLKSRRRKGGKHPKGGFCITIIQWRPVNIWRGVWKAPKLTLTEEEFCQAHNMVPCKTRHPGFQTRPASSNLITQVRSLFLNLHAAALLRLDPLLPSLSPLWALCSFWNSVFSSVKWEMGFKLSSAIKYLERGSASYRGCPEHTFAVTPHSVYVL